MPLPATVSTAPTPPPELVGLTSDKLRALLSKSLERTARELTRLAWIVRILEERGEDLADLRIGLLSYLRQIAYGQVLPEVVVRFGSSPILVRAVAALPTPDQGRLAAGAPALMVVRQGDTYTHRLVDPLGMSPGQVRQVFAADHIRDEAEQILRLQGRAAAEPTGPRKARAKGKLAIDPKGRGLWAGRTLIPTAQIVALLAELGATPETGDPVDSAVLFKLTEREHYSLKRAALDAGTSVNQLARRTLRAAGLLAGPGPEG